MNYLKKNLSAENRRKFINLFRPTSYYAHPELKINGIPKDRWKMLMTMRDLRLWVEENAPLSSRAEKYRGEIYQINHEINYLQFRGSYFISYPFIIFLAFLKAFGVYLAFMIAFLFWGPNYFRGDIASQSRPV